MENKDWREQFNEKFIQFENSIPVGGFEQAPYNRIKSFIESLLQSKQEEIEKVKFTIYDGDTKREVVGLEDIIKILK